METKLRFFKQGNNWYADVPNHTLDENEMVMGADIALDLLGKARNKEEFTITLSDKEPSQPLLHLNMKNHDDEGAWYQLSGYLYNSFLDTLMSETDCSEEFNEIWLCNVTHDVFGSHPKDIYLLKIK